MVERSLSYVKAQKGVCLAGIMGPVKDTVSFLMSDLLAIIICVKA